MTFLSLSSGTADCCSKRQYDFLVFLFIFSLHEISIKGRDRDKTEKKVVEDWSKQVNQLQWMNSNVFLIVKLLFFFRTQWTKIDNSILKLFGETKICIGYSIFGLFKKNQVESWIKWSNVSSKSQNNFQNSYTWKFLNVNVTIWNGCFSEWDYWFRITVFFIC